MPYLTDIQISAIPGDNSDQKLESLVKQINDAFRLISNEDRTKIIKDDAGIQRLLQGFHQNGFDNGNVGVKMSQEGIDVASATDSQLIFSTDFNLFKIVETGTTSFASPNLAGSSTNVSVTHSLGYNPMVLAFHSFSPTGTTRLLPYIDPQLTGPNTGMIRAEINFECVGNNTITFYQRDIASATNWTNYIRYYIIRETAQPS